MKKKVKIVVVFFVQISILFGCARAENLNRTEQLDGRSAGKTVSENTRNRKAGKKKESVVPKEMIQVEGISFSRVSGRELKITRPDKDDPFVKRYMIKRRKTGETRWQTIDIQASDGEAGGCELSFVDVLQGFEPQQYEYRIDVKTRDGMRYEAKEGEAVLASNVLLCLDPGHYEGQNVVEIDGVRYVEGDFTLELAKELKQILEEAYGISAYLTRESGTISIGGYTNGDLDQGHISMRREYAKGSNLFLSLHTNANQDGANSVETYM